MTVVPAAIINPVHLAHDEASHTAYHRKLGSQEFPLALTSAYSLSVIRIPAR